MTFREFAFLCNQFQYKFSVQAVVVLASQFIDLFAELWKVAISFVMSAYPSICMEQLVSHWTDFNEIWYLSLFWKFIEKIQILLKSDRITGTLYGDLCKCIIISCWILLRMRGFSNNSCKQNQNAFYVQYLFPANHAFMIMWKNMVEPDRPQMTV